ncbi:precorrin-3B methylase [Ahrensia sp. R2A130]|nr:precorrin-3B methylase [Ahrensia sp. R2A130]
MIVALTDAPVLSALREATGARVHGLEGRVSNADVSFSQTKQHLQHLFRDGHCIIAVMATGAVVRLLAPVIGEKQTDPPVIAVAEDGSSVVPLLGGHHGANQMARVLAEKLNGHAAITTAGDLRFGLALDCPPKPWVLSNPEQAKDVMAACLAGQAVSVDGELAMDADWVREGDLTFSDNAPVRLTFDKRAFEAMPHQLIYRRADHVLGLGCERGAPLDQVRSLALDALEQANLHRDALACLATIDLKADEAALNDLAVEWNLPLKLFSVERLEQETPRLVHPSDVVFAEVGCHGVSEGAALASVGQGGELILPKIKSARATAALARGNVMDIEQAEARSRGKLFVVGIGPGKDDWRSPEVTSMVSQATDLVAYSLYLDLLGPLTEGKTRHDFDLGAEEDRVRHAMELAGQGKDVALVCSGDAGIYAMATLVFELMDDGDLSDAANRIEVQVSPGISALQAAAARAGAPLGHDFCTISLSDLLTPWEMIQKRVRAAADGDFVIAFYNPVSRRRRTQLAWARDVLLEQRGHHAPVVLATNLGREGELVRIVPLGELLVDDVDMLTVVIVGSSDSRVVKTGDGKSYVYTPRGYAAKDTSRIGNAA